MFGKKVQYAYVPYDTQGAVKAFSGAVSAGILVIMETEILRMSNQPEP